MLRDGPCDTVEVLPTVLDLVVQHSVPAFAQIEELRTRLEGIYDIVGEMNGYAHVLWRKAEGLASPFVQGFVDHQTNFFLFIELGRDVRRSQDTARIANLN